MGSKLVPITVLTGFLGSGKTTLLRELLGHPSMRGTLVLVNEVGEIGIDHLLVRQVSEELVLLDSGCVCCTLRKDLVDQLAELGHKQARGELPAIERVVIETTGLAEPSPILSTLLSHPVLGDTFYVDGVVVTVDAQLGIDTLRKHRESEKQLGAADRVVITKVDLVEPAQVEEVVREVSSRRPFVDVVRAARGKVDAGVLRGLGHLDTRGIGRDEQEAFANSGEHAHESHAHHGAPQVGRVSVELPGAVDFRAFALWVSMLTQLNGERILRLKAIVHARGEATPIAVQAVQHVVYPPLDLPAMPELMGKSRVVVLTYGMDAREREDIRRSILALVS